MIKGPSAPKKKIIPSNPKCNTSHFTQLKTSRWLLSRNVQIVSVRLGKKIGRCLWDDACVHAKENRRVVDSVTEREQLCNNDKLHSPWLHCFSDSVLLYQWSRLWREDLDATHNENIERGHDLLRTRTWSCDDWEGEKMIERLQTGSFDQWKTVEVQTARNAEEMQMHYTMQRNLGEKPAACSDKRHIWEVCDLITRADGRSTCSAIYFKSARD